MRRSAGGCGGFTWDLDFGIWDFGIWDFGNLGIWEVPRYREDDFEGDIQSIFNLTTDLKKVIPAKLAFQYSLQLPGRLKATF